jgi:pimeloyl-ACP methyl ester carboxylesterase
MNESTDDRPWVVLVHGIGAHRAVMLPLKWGLERSGFAVHNFGYNSLRSIDHAADLLAARLEELNRRHGPSTLHLVGHSMGCIVSRLALARQRPENFQRMVMITPPSRGTPTADRFAPWLGWAVPSIPELRTRPDSLVNSLPAPDYPFALVRATWDFLIPSTHVILPGASETHEFRGTHSAVLFHGPTIQRVANFLLPPTAEPVPGVASVPSTASTAGVAGGVGVPGVASVVRDLPEDQQPLAATETSRATT